MLFLANTKSAIKVFSILLIAAPFACNFIIGTQRFSNLRVIGDEVVWLQFYGNYIGSALAVIGALYVCYLTIEENKKTQVETINNTYTLQRIDQIHKEILCEIERLSSLFENFIPSEIINFTFISQCPSQEDREKEIWRLQQLYSQYSRLMYTAEFHYHQEGLPDLCTIFFESYQRMIGNTLKTISNLVEFYKTSKASKTWEQDLEEYKSKVVELESKIKPNTVYLAKRYIEYLLDEFRKNSKNNNDFHY